MMLQEKIKRVVNCAETLFVHLASQLINAGVIAAHELDPRKNCRERYADSLSKGAVFTLVLTKDDEWVK